MVKGRKHSRPAKRLTKKQLSRHQREERQLRWIRIAVGTLVALVVIIVGVGLISQKTRALAVVNDQKISVTEYQKRTRFWYHFYNDYLVPGYFDSADPEQRDEFYRGISEQLIEEALVREEAQKRDLSVTDQEIQIEIEEAWFQHYRVRRTPTPVPTPDPEATPTPEGTPLPTPTPDTEETFTATYEEFVDKVLKPARLSQGYFRQMVEATVLKRKLEAAMVTEVPAEEEQVDFRYTVTQDEAGARTKIKEFLAGVAEQAWARHVLVETPEEAEVVLTRLGAGEDFAALAAELSTDESNKDQGGDLGWFSRGQMVPEFETAVFEGEIGVHPTPVETQFGYHIIEVLGREDRPVNLDEEMFDAGWTGRKELADRFGPLFAEMVFVSEPGLIADPVPTSFGAAVVDVLGRELRSLDEAEQEQRRSELFQSWLDEVRTEANVQDMWDANMVPRSM
ncbi:MAG: peptidylprolyl isomerase [Anaerolineae bacterium]|nr:peptidylprolyl isomerase [Anaerolineae bacterium]